MQLPGSQFALIAFDSERTFSREESARLERTLQTSQRWSLGSGVKLRLAMLVEGRSGHVGVASIGNIPPGYDEEQIQTRADGALRQVARDNIAGVVWVHHVMLVATASAVKPLSEQATALRDLVEEVGDTRDRLGKLLRIFLPIVPGRDPGPAEWRYAMGRFRQQLLAHAKELSVGRQAPSFESNEPVADEALGPGTIIDALDVLLGLNNTPANYAELSEARRLQTELAQHSNQMLTTMCSLMLLLEKILRQQAGAAPPAVMGRLRTYLDKVLRPLAALERHLR